MPTNDRLEDLRRRVQKDPASIAFAQLAEELRRAGQYEESVDVCRVGLATHPGYLSARVTLGRALMDLNRIEEAQRELELVRRSAPENLAAIRALADIHRRWGGTFGTNRGDEESHDEAASEPVTALTAAATVVLQPVVVDPPPVVVAPALVVAGAAPVRQGLAQVSESAIEAAGPTVPLREPAVPVFQDTRAARTLSALEQWLAAIHVARAQRNA